MGASRIYDVDRVGLIAEIRRQFVLDWNGIHGAPHWARVRHHGLRIAAAYGADLAVVTLFSFLHDSRREHDGRDRRHGRRAADYCESALNFDPGMNFPKLLNRNADSTNWRGHD